MPIREKKSERKFKLSTFLGTYSPPAYIRKIPEYLNSIRFSVVRAFRANKKLLLLASISVLGLCIALLAASVVTARRPKLMELRGAVYAPEPRTQKDEPVSPLILTFSGSAAKSEDVGKVVSERITLDPPLPGTWEWSDDTKLLFTPETDWSVGASYKISISKDLFPDHIHVENKYAFNTADFEVTIPTEEFYIDPNNAKIKRILATISANYPIDPESLEKNIVIKPSIRVKTGTLENREYSCSIAYDDLKLNAYVVSEPIGMPVESESVTLTVKKGLRSILGGSVSKAELSTIVPIPGISDYVEITHGSHDLVKTPDQRYDQIITISSIGSINSAELLKSISAWALPKDLPELPGQKGEKDYKWYDPQFVTDDILRISESLNLTAIPNETDYSSINSFKFIAESGRYVFFKVKSGAKFYGDYYLGKDYRNIFQIKQYPKEVSILSDGAIVSMTGSKQLAMLTRGISDITCNVGRIRPDDINHLVSQSNGDLNAISFENYYFNEYNITEQYKEERKINISGSGSVDYFSFDFSKYLNWIPDKNLRYGLFIFTVGGSTKENRNYRDKRLIMVTDLGFFVKSNADKTKDIFVQSIGDGNPVSGATVSVVSLNGNTIFNAITGNDGRVSLPDLSGYAQEKKPVSYVIRKGEDLSFMPYSEKGRAIDYSNFDVGGVIGATDPKTINAFIFSDRGFYRPGDTMHIGMIIKAGDWKINLANTPLECKIVDPKGSEVFSRKITLSPEGFEEILYRTEEYSLTGEYTASLYLILNDKKESRKYLGSETVKVEEFLPDNLNITMAFSPSPQTGWIHPDKLDAVVTLRNLFGTAAAGNDVKGQISLSPGVQNFTKFQDYSFSDPYEKDKSYKEFLGTAQTNDSGICSFPVNLAKFDKATYQLRFYAEGFEKGGGRKVNNEIRVFISPLDYLIGYKADGDLSYINRDATRLISLIGVDQNMERCQVSELSASLSEVRYVSMLVKQPNGVFKYQSVKKTYPVKSEKLAIPKNGLTYSLPTDKEGDFELVLTGTDGLIYNKISWSVIGEQNVERSLMQTAELEVKLDRYDYKNGDKIKLFIKAPYSGAGLVTIERDKVYSYTWFKTNENSSMQTIEVPADIEGNGYVNVMLVRSVSSKEIFMSPFCYASVPFSVSKGKRTNVITLDIPQETKSGSDITIKYSSSKRGKVVITAIDEGILQVSHYKTPDPIAFFFKKRALEVGTAQIMDLILPEFKVLRSLGAMGGDGQMEELNRNLNPFKRKRNIPVAYWSGVIDTGPEVRTLHYKVPDYFNGTIRVMAVAVSPDTVGSVEEKVVVRNDFIITANVPMMAAPGDTFDVSVSVTNAKKGSGSAKKILLKAEPSKHLSVLSDKQFDLVIPEGTEKTVSFQVKANNVLGGADLRFVASDGTDQTELSNTLSVRPSVPYHVTLVSGSMKNSTTRIPITRSIYDNFATRNISLSYLPTGLSKGLYFYLEKYPYGCSEQVISATWPLLYPSLIRELDIDTTAVKATVERTISILQSRLRDDGTIGIWTSSSDSDPYLTNYCTLFIIEARNNGYYISDSFLSKCLAGVRSIAESTATDSYSLANRSFAIYILTRSEIITTQYIESLKQSMLKNPESKAGYAGLFLAGSYKLLKQDLEAATLLGEIKRTFKKDDSWRYVDSLCYTSVYLDIVARHFPSHLSDVSAELISDIATELQNQQYTTISASHALMAIESYLSVTPGEKSGAFSASERDAANNATELKMKGTTLFSGTFSNKAAELSIQNRNTLPLFYQVTTAGFDLEQEKTEIKQGIEIYREFTDLSGNKVLSVQVGDEVLVKINIRTTNNNTQHDVAIVDMFPAGLEPDIDSIRKPERKINWIPSYVDIREDRIVFFGTAQPELRTFEYRARAVNSGTFIVPPLFAEAMYDKKVWAIKPQSPLIVTKNKESK